MCTNYNRIKALGPFHDAFSQLKLPLLKPEPHQQPNLPAQPSIRPTDDAVIFRPYEAGVEMVWARWGLIPFFHRGDPKSWKANTVNARSDRVKESATFKSAFARRRCLVAFDSIFEWNGPKGSKQRWEITPTNGSIFIAGLWDRYTFEGDPIESFAMMTTASAPPISPDIHDRSPIFLTNDQVPRWLDTGADVDDILNAPNHPHFRIEKAPSLAEAAALEAAELL